MPRKKSLLGQCKRNSAPVPTRQLKFLTSDVSPTRIGSSRPSRNKDRSSRIPRPRSLAMRKLSLESEERVPSRRSRSAFATPEGSYKRRELFAFSTQRRTICTPSSSGSYQPWLSTTKKVGKGMKKHSEKYEQAEMVVKIQDYFCRQDLGESLIPMTGLHQRIMTLNLFVGLTTHLLAVFYPKHGITMSNYTEKIPQMVKALGYTGNLTKSWLRTANNSHSWPHVLKLLSFLVDRVEMGSTVIDDIMRQLEQESYEETPVTYKDMFDYYLNTYVMWDQEQLDDIEVATSQIEEKFNAGLVSEEELQARAGEVEQLKQKLDDPLEAEEEARFQALKAEHDALQEDFVQFSSEVAAEEKVLNGLQQQLLDLSVLKENLEKQLQEKHRQVQLKQMQVSVQKVSVEEKQLIDQKMASLQVDVDNLEAIKSRHLDDLCSKDMQIAQLHRNILAEKERLGRKLQELEDPRLEELRNRPGVGHEEIMQVLGGIVSGGRTSASALKEQLPARQAHLEELKQQLKDGATELEEERGKVKSLRLSMEKMEENFRQKEAEHMFESQQIQNQIKRFKESSSDVQLQEAIAKLKKEKQELIKILEFRAKNARTAVEVMTQHYADFKIFRESVAKDDRIAKLLEGKPKPPPPSSPQ